MLPFYQFDWTPFGAFEKDVKFIDAPKPELYDTAADPAEKRNLYGERKAAAAQLKRCWRAKSRLLA